jgi:hypothetical protein
VGALEAAFVLLRTWGLGKGLSRVCQDAGWELGFDQGLGLVSMLFGRSGVDAPQDFGLDEGLGPVSMLFGFSGLDAGHGGVAEED